MEHDWYTTALQVHRPPVNGNSRPSFTKGGGPLGEWDGYVLHPGVMKTQENRQRFTTNERLDLLFFVSYTGLYRFDFSMLSQKMDFPTTSSDATLSRVKKRVWSHSPRGKMTHMNSFFRYSMHHSALKNQANRKTEAQISIKK